MPDLTLVSDKKIENKILGGQVISCKQEERNGIKVGIVEGYIATWDIDRGDWWGIKDQFIRGAFTESLNDLRMRKRQIRLKDHHGRTVGGFPIETVKEDERGLFGIGEINLDVQQGREAYSLAKQGVLSDFSIGFSTDESSLNEQEDLRSIHKATIWEGSIVDEPMNPYANITAVKGLAKNIIDSMCKDTTITEVQQGEMQKHIEKCLKELSDIEANKIDIEGLKDIDGRDVEQQLKKTNLFSNNVCKLIVKKLIDEGKIDGKDTERRQDGEKPPLDGNKGGTAGNGSVAAGSQESEKGENTKSPSGTNSSETEEAKRIAEAEERETCKSILESLSEIRSIVNKT